MSLLTYIRLPLIALLQSVIDYLQHELTPAPPSSSTSTLPDTQAPQCKHCKRDSIICGCNNIHCQYHRTKSCHYQAV